MVFREEIQIVLNLPCFCFNEKINTKKAYLCQIFGYWKKHSKDFSLIFFLSDFKEPHSISDVIWQKTKEECLLNLLCLFLAVNILKLYFSLVFHWNSFSTILILHFILKIMINLRQYYLASEPKVFLEPRFSGCAPSFHMWFFPSSVSRLLLLR